MLKKTLVLSAVVVLLVSMMIVPASAAITYFDFTDYIDYQETIAGNIERVYVDVPKQNLFITIRNNINQLATVQGDENGATLTFNVIAGGRYRIIFGVRILWLGNIPNHTEIDFHPYYSYSGVDHETPDLYYFSNFLEEDGTILYENNYSIIDDYPISSIGSPHKLSHYGGESVYSCSFGYSFHDFIPKTSGKITLKFTECRIGFRFSPGYMEKLENDNNAILAEKNHMLLENQQALLEELESQQAVTNDKLDQMPGEIGDEIEGIIDNENQAASDAGDSAAGELMDIIPNESDGFINAIGSLVNSMSYNGTDAVLPVPAITLPEIPGVMSAVKLTDKQEVDFGFWIQKLPSNILQLVRILCTIALIVYCFKELYSTISYALTLKGGKSDE